MEAAEQFAKELLRPAQLPRQRRQVGSSYPNDIWTADLVDYQRIASENGGTKFLLTIVDVYSRYAWIIPLKDKSAANVKAGFDSIGSTPEFLWVDQGKEFTNKVFQQWFAQHGIRMYHTYGEHKAAIAERFNRTVRDMLAKEMMISGTNEYVDLIPQIVKRYNTRVHGTTHQTPYDAYTGQVKSAQEVFEGTWALPKFADGDLVRISKTKKTFEPGYTSRWSKEVFRVARVNTQQDPIVYHIEDLQGEEIDGSFYAEEMQKSLVPNHKIIDQVLKRKTVNGSKMMLVSYRSWPAKFNEWIPDTQM